MSMRFDILMPTILFLVTLVAMTLGRRAESKLKATVEDREFKNRDVALMAAMIAVAISIVMFIPSLALIALFMFSYSSLLFTVSYAFSDLKPHLTTFYCVGFIVVGLLAIAAAFLGVVPVDLQFYAILAFASFAVLAFFALACARLTPETKQKWYLAGLAPALFVLLFAFFSSTFVWFPYLLDVYGIIFAMLIVIYLNSLFTWKTTFIFAAALTVMDMILVWVTQTMVVAAEHISGLGLPVLVAFPTIPFITTQEGILLLRLGLGDFFFAGILSSQTMKKYGRKTAIISILTMSISFGIFELILLNPELTAALPVPALPATLPILLGWLPVVLVKMVAERGQKPKEPKAEIIPPPETQQ
ncbi:MAG: hypothetical protein NWF00_06475 [Candidatus Bathyarchaeota archaeon]|nr:hypothetical protein [Candidatus Bathyarchaeota archaeon]